MFNADVGHIRTNDNGTSSSYGINTNRTSELIFKQKPYPAGLNGISSKMLQTALSLILHSLTHIIAQLK